MLHYSLEVVYFLWLCCSLSTFHLLALLADVRTDDALFYVKSISSKSLKFVIDGGWHQNATE